LTQDLSMRVSLLNQTRDDWVANTNLAGPTREFEGYRDSAMRTQLLYDGGAAFSALANIHARDYRGSARVFRANIIQPGTNDFVPGFDERQVSFDGKNKSEQQNYGGSLRLRFGLPGFTLYSVTGYETVRTYSGGDIDGGSAPYVFGGGAGAIPFYSETADGIPEHRQITQEFRAESTGSGPLGWQAGLYLFNED
jgi:iron complex outermembrane recepter protein